MYVVLHRFYTAPPQGNFILMSITCFDIGWETDQKHKAIILNVARKDLKQIPALNIPALW